MQKEALIPKVKRIRRSIKHHDKGEPKRPMGAFLYFLRDHRVTLKREGSNLTNKEIISDTGKKWRNMKENERKIYELVSKNDKERYKKERKKYNNEKSRSTI